jgi:hypothetical protein
MGTAWARHAMCESAFTDTSWTTALIVIGLRLKTEIRMYLGRWLILHHKDY